MLTKQEIFELYDKEKKSFLSKHQLKLALIYILGYKLRYDEIKKIWNNRFEF
jgi:Ca2+-binding EF-hand superfamily protein